MDAFVCPVCRRELPLGMRAAHRRECKACHAAYMREYRAGNFRTALIGLKRRLEVIGEQIERRAAQADDELEPNAMSSCSRPCPRCGRNASWG